MPVVRKILVIYKANMIKGNYGHFDYTIHQGNVLLHDINKTTGSGTLSLEHQIKPFHDQ